LDRGASSKSTGSETIGAPGGIVTEGRPPNVSALPPSGSIAPPPADSATCAARIVRGFAPKALEGFDLGSM
jgi:hypothetical protein